MLRAGRMVMLLRYRYCLADASRHRMTNGDDDVREQMHDERAGVATAG